LNLNGGVYQVTRLTLADGARLEPSEPVVILVTGAVNTGIGSAIQPSGQSINPMGAADIRIEANGAINLGDSSQIRAHLLSNGKITTGKNVNLTGAAWGRAIAIGSQSVITIDGVFGKNTPSVPPPCNDNNICTVDACVGGGTAVAFCRNAPQPPGTSCDDGNFCNGTAACDASGTCQPGTAPPPGTSCADGDVCNGDETCDGFSTCVSGPPPVVTDGNPCTADVCDAINGVSHDPVPDGTPCNGSGTCQAGTCTVQSVIYSQDFFQGVGANEQCPAWEAFRSQLTSTSYSSVTMSGTFDTTGVTCNDPTVATQICRALNSGSFLSVPCNGRIWNVGDCGNSVELSADGSTCVCDFGYVARPCIDGGFSNPNWGGMNTSTCFGPSQNMTVVCQ
jgi:hypothetical protein